VKEYQVDNLLIAMPSATSTSIREVVKAGRKAGVAQLQSEDKC